MAQNQFSIADIHNSEIATDLVSSDWESETGSDTYSEPDSFLTPDFDTAPGSVAESGTPDAPDKGNRNVTQPQAARPQPKLVPI